MMECPNKFLDFNIRFLKLGVQYNVLYLVDVEASCQTMSFDKFGIFDL